MSICLVVQKDTFENGKVKSVFKKIDNDPYEFVKSLQDNHCIEYQLLGYISDFSEKTENKLNSVVSSYKTNHGKDWYEFDQETLSKIITVFIKYERPVLNIKSITKI